MFANTVTPATQLLEVGNDGQLDNWDPAVTDALAAGREVVLFDNAGVGRSSGTVPTTVAGMATHGSLFQFHESFARQASAFLASDSPFAPY
jgi:pimeloyl-ACP methyl ester carboxylesterase